ncbi:MAG TPA: hypothetical protein VLB44_01545 [Kofleriaceae bacterium]|nr:hypothetical protein [Kofleriaceae bacterium]
MQRTTWIALWGVLAIAATFVDGIVRLGMRAYTEMSPGISAEQWVALALLTLMMTYVEGYRALQRRFVPSVVSRAWSAGGRPLWAMLAPLYAVSLVGAPVRTIARSLSGMAMIVLCVVLVRQLPSPWRGIIDAAVACALGWGLVALLASCAFALAGTYQVRRGATAEVVTLTREAT